MQGYRFGNQFSEFFKSKSLLSIIILVNVALWLVGLLFPLVDYLYARPAGTVRAGWMEWMALSSQVEQLVRHPWTIVTYMFLHEGFFHLLFNMLMLYVGGTLCCRYMGSRRFGWIYFLGGVAGGVFYLLVYNLFPVGRMGASMVVGASAAVLAVFIAVATYAPNQEVGFWMIRTFNVKLKYIALAFVVVDLLSIPISNAGGHIAHLGGALFGFVYVMVMRYNDSHAIRRPVRKPRVKKRKRASQRPLTDEEYNARKHADQKRVDAILDKISRSGYDHLTKEEKEFLFKYKG